MFLILDRTHLQKKIENSLNAKDAMTLTQVTVEHNSNSMLSHHSNSQQHPACSTLIQVGQTGLTSSLVGPTGCDRIDTSRTRGTPLLLLF